MTITEASSQGPTADVVGVAPTRAVEPLFARAAGRLAMAAGGLMVGAQLLMLPFDPKDHIATSQNVQFQIGGAFYLAGFCTLLFAAIGLYGWQARRSERLGTTGVTLAVLGTMLLGGDLWFETFAIPWLADSNSPQVFDSDPTVLLGLGALSSYFLFAVGWCAFGISSYRARVFPRSICVAIAVTGIIGWNALIAPFGVPLAISVGVLGSWVARRTPAKGTGELVAA